MGLTKSSSGAGVLSEIFGRKAASKNEFVVALAGNPNVGKSTLFNSLTGMNRHTGNWPGKTVDIACGSCRRNGMDYSFVDLPGTYSLMTHSAEEEVARGFICFASPDVTLVVCDATCLERNLNLALQIIEMSPRVVIAVNLMDEAEKKGLSVDCALLSSMLGVKAVPISARKKRNITELFRALEKADMHRADIVRYPTEIERAVAMIEPDIKYLLPEELSPRWVALRLLEDDGKTISEIEENIGVNLSGDSALSSSLLRAKEYLASCRMTGEVFHDAIVSSVVRTAERTASKVISIKKQDYDALDRKIDSVITSKPFAYPLMLLLLGFILWLSITGANYPSRLLSNVLFGFEDVLAGVFHSLNAPQWLTGLLVFGMYRVLAWVVSVMLPPMAIFFPLFTLLEDVGYLPRIAYNLDGFFKKCDACGKQALTACMGLGCNAAGVVGCRVIDSPRERLMALLTNCFIPCNGKFPTIIALISMFFVPHGNFLSSVLPTLMLTGAILLGITMMFAATKLLSKTILKGIPSSFTLELPPYRRPEVGKVIVRSVFDRTLFVLARAAAVAAPAGMVIWLMANTELGGVSLLNICSSFLDPFAKLMGLDGVILMAFILGFPANEIVVPIIIMAYMAGGTITEAASIMEMKALFVQNGWTWVTALCTMLFSLMHWPCSTTLLTIKKETGSLKWACISVLLPTSFGVISCILVSSICKMFI